LTNIHADGHMTGKIKEMLMVNFYFREKKRIIPMDEPLTSYEDVVFCELTRHDVEPDQIPPELFEGFF